jgi:glucose/arabinose dehydrogenase
LVFGPDGNLYVSDFTNDRVLRHNGAGGFEAFASGSGLDGPTGLVFGPDGYLYVSSYNTDQVLRYTATGTFDKVFASGSGLDGSQGLLFGPDNNLYVSGEGTDGVLRYDGSTGAFIDAFVAAGSGGLDRPVYMTFTTTDPTTLAYIPEASTLTLFGVGLAALAMVRWRRRRVGRSEG